MSRENRVYESREEAAGKRESHGSFSRLLFYSICCIMVNLMLGWFLVYVIRQNTGIKWMTLASKPYLLIIEVVLRGLYLLSPFFLTYIVNNALLQLFFLKEQAPKGIRLMSLLLILVVQISFICGTEILKEKRETGQETATAVMECTYRDKNNGGSNV